MEGIVIELQREALDKNADIESLLRKAYLVARKLKLSDFEDWIKQEQDGYKKEVPEYRYVRGEIKALNPMRGWVPFVLSPKMEEKLTKMPIINSISSISDVYESGDNPVTFTINAEVIELLNRCSNAPFDTTFSFWMSRSEFYRILETVRNKILEWALLLEENGIVGENLSFTDVEKKAAQTSQVINNYVNNFFDDVNDLDLQQGGLDNIQNN